MWSQHSVVLVYSRKMSSVMNLFNTFIWWDRFERTPHIVIDLLKWNNHMQNWCRLHLHSIAFGVVSIHRQIQFCVFHHHTTQLVYIHENTTSFRLQLTTTWGKPSPSWRVYIITSLTTLNYLQVTSSFFRVNTFPENIYWNNFVHLTIILRRV